MQIAATNPIAIRREDIDPELTDREKSIYHEQAKTSGKSEEIIDKIVEGKLNKFFQDNCLLEQTFIKDSEKNIQGLLNEIIVTLGENISVNRFTRFAIGEDT
jgi:elongation factor Ts